MVRGEMPTASSLTGSERLDFLATQVWGPALVSGDARVSLGARVEDGWEVREDYRVIPSAQTAQLLLPQARRAAARSLADYAGLRSPRTRIARRALAVAATAGAPISRTRVRVLARVGAPPTTVSAVAQTVGRPGAVAALGVRTGANAKPTLELRTPDGEAVGFVKLAWNDLTTEAIDNEAQALKALGSGASSAIRAPHLLADGLIDGRRYLMTEALPRSISDVPATWRSLSHAEVVGPGAVYARRVLASAGQVGAVRAAIDAASTVTPARLAARARDLLHAVTSMGVTIPIADYWHGDFVPWNVGRDDQSRLWLFDWETAQSDVPAGLDTLHWFANTEGRQNPSTSVARLAAGAERAKEVLRSLGYSRAGVAVISCWYAVTLVAGELHLAESLQSWDRVKHSPSVLEQFLAWGSATLRSVPEEEPL